MHKEIGAQYYTIRDFIKTPEAFDEACGKIAEIGYKVVQISGCPLTADEMKPILDKHRLKVCLTHRAFDDFKSNLEEVIDYNKKLGCDICGIGMMPVEYVESSDTLTKFITEANEICKSLKKEGMYMGYHNHAFEFIKHDGKAVFDRLVDEIDSETFVFIVDTYWVQVGGRNPEKVIENLGERAMIVHFKDYAINPDDVFKPEYAEIGCGNLNWDNIIKASEKARYAVVEQDECRRDPFESLKISYDYLTTKGFV